MKSLPLFHNETLIEFRIVFIFHSVPDFLEKMEIFHKILIIKQLIYHNEWTHGKKLRKGKIDYLEENPYKEERFLKRQKIEEEKEYPINKQSLNTGNFDTFYYFRLE